MATLTISKKSNDEMFDMIKSYFPNTQSFTWEADGSSTVQFDGEFGEENQADLMGLISFYNSRKVTNA